jgi:hypothetical protein
MAYSCGYWRQAETLEEAQHPMTNSSVNYPVVNPSKSTDSWLLAVVSYKS